MLKVCLGRGLERHPINVTLIHIVKDHLVTWCELVSNAL